MPQISVRQHRKRGGLKTVHLDRPGVDPTWQQAIDAFLRDAVSRNLSPSTLANFRSYLLGPRAQQFLVDHEVTSISSVTPNKLRDFQAELLEAGLAPGTVATFHRIMQNFLNFARREGWSVVDGVRDVAPPRLAQEEPETFTEAEERQLLQACELPRDKFLIEFLLRTGVRRTEAANVTVDDIVQGTSGSFLRVRQGKGRKDRIVPLDSGGVKFSKKVDSYIRNVRPTETASRHLFLSSRPDGPGGIYTQLTSYGIQCLLNRLGERTGIHCHAHKFRHTFATRSLAAGVDVMALQRVLGHTTIAMVMRYVHYQTDDLINAWKKRQD